MDKPLAINRGTCVVTALVALLIIFFGVWYVHVWYVDWTWGVTGNEVDLPFGIGAFLVGVTILLASVVQFRRIGRAGKTGG